MLAVFYLQTFSSSGLLSLLVTLLVGAVIIYIVSLIIGMLKLPAPVANIIYLILALLVILWLLGRFGILAL